MEKHYLVLAYYKFVSLEAPHLEIKEHKLFFQNREVAGRIYISEEGINGQMSGKEKEARDYMEWLSSRSSFKGIHFKMERHHENIFPRMTVKYRKQLVALDEKADVKEGGTHLSPAQWRKFLETEKDILLLDVRNHYEWEIGRFEKATLPPLEQFREFPTYAEKLKKQIDPDTKVMMYCTGGIRCELFSSILKKKGFKNVYQLEGGILNYGEKEGNAHWKGKLFVFDDRLAIPLSNSASETPISQCHHCHLPSDTYYNCANMDCNHLFLSCPSCHHIYKGACSHSCSLSPRLRPYNPKQGNKPFRRKHLLPDENKSDTPA